MVISSRVSEDEKTRLAEGNLHLIVRVPEAELN